MRKIGLLTSGGDCQALNAAMRGVVKGLSNNLDGLEVYGFYEGYKGLIYGKYRLLTSSDFSGILTKGGTILGSSRQPFKLMRQPDENGLDKVEAMKHTYYKLNLDCLVILGGNGTQKTANLLREEGLNIIHLPKTIDNDIYGTDVTFGFQSAINIAADAIDCIHTTAASHNRVFIVEVMGHKVGWLTLYAGIAAGADIILIPEIPYDIDKVAEAIQKRTKAGKGFTVLAVAEGAISKKDAKLSKKEYVKKMEKSPYPSVSYEVAALIEKKLGVDTRVTVRQRCHPEGWEPMPVRPCTLQPPWGSRSAGNYRRRLRQYDCNEGQQDGPCAIRKSGRQTKDGRKGFPDCKRSQIYGDQLWRLIYKVRKNHVLYCSIPEVPPQ